MSQTNPNKPISYSTFAKKWRNFAQVTGSKSTAKKIYGWYLADMRDGHTPEMLSPRIQAVLATTAKRSGKYKDLRGVPTQARAVGEQYLEEEWAGAISRSKKVNDAYIRWKTGKITAARFNEIATKWSADLKKRRENDPTYQYDES